MCLNQAGKDDKFRKDKNVRIKKTIDFRFDKNVKKKIKNILTHQFKKIIQNFTKTIRKIAFICFFNIFMYKFIFQFNNKNSYEDHPKLDTVGVKQL